MTLLLLLALSSPPDDLRPQIFSFVSVMNSFVERYAGCPAGTREYRKDLCTLPPRFDAKAWEEARKRAAELFQLEYPKRGKGEKKKK